MFKFLVSTILILNVGCAHWSSKKKEQAGLFLQLGTSQFENGEYPSALKNLLQSESLDSTNQQTQNMLGMVYFMRQRYDLSEKHLLRALSLDSRFTEARNNIGRLYIELKNYPKADEELKKVLDDLTYNGVAKAQINWGLSKFYQKQYTEALQAFSQAIQQENDNCLAHTMLGRTYFENNNNESAVLALDKAIGFCQKALFDEPHYYSALSYYRLGDKPRSISRFKEVVKLYPNGKYNEKSRAMLDLIQKVEHEKNR